MTESERDPLRLAATPHRVRLVARAANLSDVAVLRGVQLATATPHAAEWRRFLAGTLAYFGTGLLLAGVVCFIAYNWTRIGRFGKLGLLELAIAGATVLAWRKLPRVSGQMALFGASALVGALLAMYGQTYQTGADPYGLFLTWSLLVVPWAVAARFGALWLLVLLLLDVSLALFYMQVLPPTTAGELSLSLWVAAIHAVALVAWEWQLRRSPAVIPEAWVSRVIALTGFIAVFVPAAAFIITGASGRVVKVLGVLGLAAAITATTWYYRRVRSDRFMVTLAVVAGMAWITVLLGRALFRWLELREFGLFIMAAFVIWQISFGLKLYRRSRAS